MAIAAATPAIIVALARLAIFTARRVVSSLRARERHADFRELQRARKRRLTKRHTALMSSEPTPSATPNSTIELM